MRIVIAATTDIYFDQRVCKIADALVRCNHQVIVVGRQLKSIEYPALPFNVILLPCFFKKGVAFYLEYNIRLLFYLWKNSYDFICACDLDTVLAVGLIASIKKRTWSFDAHEYFENSIELHNKRFKKWIWTQMGRFFVPKARICYSVSQTLCDELSKNYNKKFELIRNVSRLNPNANFSAQGRSKILWYQGAINKGRGLELLLICLAKLPDYYIQFAGTGDILDELKLLAESLNIENRVEFLGRLPMAEMQSYASKAWIGFDLLDNQSLSYYYSLSNKTFDYMHTAIPIVQMNFPEYVEIHKSFPVGILLDSLDENKLISSILKFEDEQFYNLCLESCKAATQSYHWDLESEKLCSVYDFGKQ